MLCHHCIKLSTTDPTTLFLALTAEVTDRQCGHFVLFAVCLLEVAILTSYGPVTFVA